MSGGAPRESRGYIPRLEPRREPLRLRFMRLAALGVLATSVLLTGCAESSTPSEDASRVQAGVAASSDNTSAGEGNDDTSMVAPALDAKWRGTLTVNPAAATPGQRVALRFRSKNVRGIAFSLSTWGEKGWTVTYYLTSDWGSPGSHSPDWWSVENSESRVWVDVGVGGPGPDHVIVPDNAPADDYLLCTANSADKPAHS